MYIMNSQAIVVIIVAIIVVVIIVVVIIIINTCRLYSLARPSDQEHLLMADTDMNPESGSTLFSAITGKRSLTQKWEVINVLYPL